MVQVKLEPSWIPAKDLPARYEIVKVKPVEDKTKNGRAYTWFLLTLMRNGQLYEYSAKFGDVNFLVNTISPDTDQWIGKEVSIRMDDEGKYKQLSF